MGVCGAVKAARRTEDENMPSSRDVRRISLEKVVVGVRLLGIPWFFARSEMP